MNVLKKVPVDAAVSPAEVKPMNQDALHETCSCDSRFWTVSNISQLSKVKYCVILTVMWPVEGV